MGTKLAEEFIRAYKADGYKDDGMSGSPWTSENAARIANWFLERTVPKGGTSCTPVEWEKEFDKKFRIMERTDIEEVDGIFAIESDRQKVKDFIRQNFISREKVAEVVERMRKEMINDYKDIGGNYYTEITSYNSALEDIKRELLN